MNRIKLFVTTALIMYLTVPSLAMADFEVKRLFESSSMYVKVIIETDKPRKIKCAVYDSNHNPLRVDTQIVTPPLDELLIRTGDKTKAVKTVKCWEMK